ncbi:malate dehydrogenase [Exiguobacterium sp. A1_3_1]|uniref:Malate dehydrogenase n=1 Tax=Exiguobacterium indicum TaxID=296995 RepID=A0AAW3MB37_9BACL|nr:MULTISPECIES: malate dehydrogenase [Exiguobacterium]KTR26194.1 malate dehydrogenase [Exiguobacterium indicum]MCQ4089568.1 malate dehydrogenase [Exiguobacterium sp. LL15]
MNRRKKIAVIGSGFTGATTALYLAQRELGDVVLVDRPEQENPTKGKALDMQEAAPILGFDASVKGTSNYADINGADIVVITAGIARKPGMSREDLVSTNAAVMTAVTKEIVAHAPESIIIVLTNPVDAMTYTVYQASGFPKERVIGQSGVLDTARFRTFLAEELNVSVKDVSGFVLGGHGDDMVPLLRYSQAGGIPIEKLISKERLEAIVDRTRKGGGEIVQLLGNGSAYYAPAAAIAEMVEAILKDQRRILPAIAYLEGEYGYDDMYFGVPVILGGNGVEHVYELELTTEEQEALNRSASTVRSVLDLLKS